MEEVLTTILLGGVPDTNVLDWFGIQPKMLNEIRGLIKLDPIPLSRAENYDWLWEACKDHKRVKAIELLLKSGFDLTPIRFGNYMKELEIGGLTKYRSDIGMCYRIDKAELLAWFNEEI